MKWTLFACFGCTNHRKRPRSSKLRPKTKRIQGYQQLQSHVPRELDDEDLRNKPKEENKARIRKKVRFNLDVIIYEPTSDNYDTSNLQEESNGKDSEEQAHSQIYGLYAPARAVQSFPASHIYENFYDNKDYYDENEYEDEGSECEFSDLEDDNEDDDDVINYRDLSSKPLISSTDKSLRISSEKSTYGQSRRHYAVAVLNPIENLSQWKAIKVRKC